MKNSADTIKNNKVLFSNVLGTIGIKGLSLLISFFTIPAYMHYFSDQQVLGIWFALLSLLNWILTFDLGIGNGLRNHLVEAIVEKDTIKAKRYISSSYLIIGFVSLILIVIGNIAIGFCNWNFILNISNAVLSNSILIIVVRIVFTGVILQFFFKLILSILYAMQKTALANFISLLSNSLILLFVICFKGKNIESNLLMLSIANILTVNIPLVLATIVVFIKPLKLSKPNIKYYVKEYAKEIMKLGYMFFWIQITLLIINSSNEFLIACLYGPEYVVEYQVYNKIFLMFITMFSIITNPVWSSVTTAYNENRFGWIRKTCKYLNIFALGVCSACFCVVPFFQYIVNIWLGAEAITVNIFSAVTYATYSSIMVFIYSSTCIANGMGRLKPQILCNTIAVIVKIPITVLMTQFINNWIGVVLVNIIISIPCVIIQPIATKRYLQDNLANEMHKLQLNINQ